MLAFQEWVRIWALEAYRVLKPGGHALIFGGTRTHHRMISGVEDAGFEIRDCLMWLYGSGFPKSLDVSKAIDKAAGAEREITRPATRPLDPGDVISFDNRASSERETRTIPAAAAAAWSGWGTALKPAYEPIVLARKPLGERNVAANVLRHGTGAINVDGCRIGDESIQTNGYRSDSGQTWDEESGMLAANVEREPSVHAGRWPANALLDEAAAALLDEQSGELTSGANPERRGADSDRGTFGAFQGQANADPKRGCDSGGASRFFYTAKADRAERNAGLAGMTEKPLNWSSGDQSPGTFQAEGTHRAARNHHPTVKPVDLMCYLVRLITPPGGTVLDPFMGSGSTGMAALRQGFAFIGIEREQDYMAIARRRIEEDAPLFNRAES